jgi:hypothetical protein
MCYAELVIQSNALSIPHKHMYATDSEDAFYKDKGSQRMTLTSMDEENR